ncbi:hypothetical protein KC909_03610 [Candidatus Dojkabacteria bacterium]|uniref:Uncharacterized protein n=1 Tax=Candidatus Dojkabacteria bacterium TaxID=2099670 RepID=A0A955RIZ8_9BACT|nr:hypothetical protein [Candidatus Dojkabacteria bacterium]
MEKKENKHSMADHKALGPMVGFVAIIFFFVGFLFGFVLFYFIYVSDTVKVELNNNGGNYLRIYKPDSMQGKMSADVEYEDGTVSFEYPEEWMYDVETGALSADGVTVVTLDPGLVALEEGMSCYGDLAVDDEFGGMMVLENKEGEFGTMMGAMLTLHEEGMTMEDPGAVMKYCVELDGGLSYQVTVAEGLDEMMKEDVNMMLSSVKVN